ncbi:ATP synthase protein I [Lipingzhangella halophila]|uniref:ATP synthase protein I n=1 Tax=Lipingzhangella halophila TaxID=1783352 RepID=A0A7W7W450_9ACTN|nr:hypothetical protein [Lipingzhangella halophila]MBB4933732.1 ATP synthase protein I [Lipingzhangella halophila]
MQEHDARVFRGAAIPTAIVGSIAMVVAFAMKGVPGLIGALVGTLLVVAFFAVSFVVVSWAGRVGPHLMFPAAMASYVLKIVLLGVLLAVLRDVGGFDRMAFGATAITGSLVWVGAHMRAMATDRRPIIEETDSAEPESAARSAPAGRRS